MSGRDRLERCFESSTEAGKCLAELVPSTYTHACACGKAGCKRCGRRREATDYELDYVLVDYWTHQNSPMIIGGLNRSREWVVLQIPISLYYLQPADNRILNRQMLSESDAKAIVQRLYEVLASHDPGTKSASGVLVAPEAIVRTWRAKEKLSGRAGTIHQPAAEPICPSSGLNGNAERKMYFDPFLKRCFVFTSQEQARLVDLLNRQPAGYVTVLQDTKRTKILLAYTRSETTTTTVIPQTPLIRARSPIDLPELMQLRYYDPRDEAAWMQFIADENRQGQTVSPQDFYIWLYREAERIRNWTASVGGEKRYCTQILSLGWNEKEARCEVQSAFVPPPSPAVTAGELPPLHIPLEEQLPPLEVVPEEMDISPPILTQGPVQIVTIWADPITPATTSPPFTQSTANLRGGADPPEYVKLAWTSDGHVIVVNPPVLLAELTDNPRQLDTLMIRPGATTQIIFQRLLNAVHTHLATLVKTSGNARSTIQLFQVSTQDAKWNVIVEPTAIFRAQLAERIQYILPVLNASECDGERKWDEDKRLCRRMCPPGFLIDGNNCIPGVKGRLNQLGADTKYVSRAANAQEDTSATRLAKAQKDLDDYKQQSGQTNDSKAIALQKVADYAAAEKKFDDTVAQITTSIEELKVDQALMAGPLRERLTQRNPENLQNALDESWNELALARAELGVSQATSAQLRLHAQVSQVLIEYANTYARLVKEPVVPSLVAVEQKYVEDLTQVTQDLKNASDAVTAEISALSTEQLSGKIRDVKQMELVDDLYRAFADKLSEAVIVRHAIETDPRWRGGEPAAVPSALRKRIQQLLTRIDTYVEFDPLYVEQLRNAHQKFNAYLPVCLKTRPDLSKESHYEDRISMVHVSAPGQMIRLAWNQCGQWIVPAKDIELKSLGVDLPNIMLYRGNKYSDAELAASVAAARALPKNGMGAGTQAEPFKALTSVVIKEIRAGVTHFEKVSNRLCSAYPYTSMGTDVSDCVSVCLPHQQFDPQTRECKDRPKETPSATGPVGESTAPPVLDLPLPGPLPALAPISPSGPQPPPLPPSRRPSGSAAPIFTPPPPPPVALAPVANILTVTSDNKDRARVYQNIKSKTECGVATPNGLGYWDGQNCVPCLPTERWDGDQCIRKTIIVSPSEQVPEAPEAPPPPRTCAPDEYLVGDDCKKKPLKAPPTRPNTRQRAAEEKNAAALAPGALLAEIKKTGQAYGEVIAARAQARAATDRKSCEELGYQWEDENEICNPCDAGQEYIPLTGACAKRLGPLIKPPASKKEVKQEQESIADALRTAMVERAAALKGLSAKDRLRERLTAANTEQEAEAICREVAKSSDKVRALAKDNDVDTKIGGKNVPIQDLCFQTWKKIKEYK